MSNTEELTNIERLIKWLTLKKKRPTDKPGLIELVRLLSPKDSRGLAVFMAGSVACIMLIMTGGANGAGWFLLFLWAIY